MDTEEHTEHSITTQVVCIVISYFMLLKTLVHIQALISQNKFSFDTSQYKYCALLPSGTGFGCGAKCVMNYTINSTKHDKHHTLSKAVLELGLLAYKTGTFIA